jgi:Lar family restriction alleviation protein
MANKEIIKCCPFCGSDEVEVCRTNKNAYWIRCGECGADAESHRTRKRAINNWNRRIYNDIPSTITDDQDKD